MSDDAPNSAARYLDGSRDDTGEIKRAVRVAEIALTLARQSLPASGEVGRVNLEAIAEQVRGATRATFGAMQKAYAWHVIDITISAFVGKIESAALTPVTSHAGGEVERVARAMYERVIRSTGKNQSWDKDSDEIERGIYLDDARAAIAALAPATSHADAGEWVPDPRTVDVIIAEMDCHTANMSGRELTKYIRLRSAIRNLSPPAASSEGGGV